MSRVDIGIGTTIQVTEIASPRVEFEFFWTVSDASGAPIACGFSGGICPAFQKAMRYAATIRGTADGEGK